MEKYSLGNIRKELFKELVQIVSDSISQAYPETMSNLKLSTKNSRHFLLWDLLNTSVMKELPDFEVFTVVKKRGIWEFVLIYDSSSGTIFTLMKEKRFWNLKSEKSKRKNLHYVDALVTLNCNLQAKVKQIRITDIEEFDDIQQKETEEEIARILEYLCSNFRDSENKIVANHVLITFSHTGNILNSINAYVIDNDFDEVESMDLSEYICADIGYSENQPDTQKRDLPKLQLSDKARKKQGNAFKTKLKENNQDKNKES